MKLTAAKSLGDVESARTRTLMRRSAVLLTDSDVIVGTPTGSVTAFDRQTLSERWSVDGRGSVVSLVPFAGGVAVGERSPAGTIRLVGATDGVVRWSDAASNVVGEPQKATPNFYPTVVDACAAGELLFVAVRRMALSGDQRTFSSVVYAFDSAGGCRWQDTADAAVTSLDVRGDRVAVAYNRCPGRHDSAVAVLDAKSGTERTSWSPDGTNERRAGDVALLPDGIAVTNYGDRRGYVLDRDGSVRFRVDLGTPTEVDGELVSAYPSRVVTTGTCIAFATGNSYSRENRAPMSVHPREYSLRCYSTNGRHCWDADVGGRIRELATDDERLLVPSAQNLRTRDAATHGVGLFDIADGERAWVGLDGIATAGSLSSERFAVVEEPIEYHDESFVRGAFALHVGHITGE